MADLNYLAGRRKYGRPQALLFANYPGQLEQSGDNKVHVPYGVELGTRPDQANDSAYVFLTLSDHNRGPIDVKSNRLETRERTLNGKMRSYYNADKQTISVSWKDLPSRSFSDQPNFDTTTGQPDGESIRYTVDGGAGGNDLLYWYYNFTGSFYLFISYDKYTEFIGEENVRNRLNEYQEVLEVFVSDFSYTINKRGQHTHDLWDVSITLEEV